MRELIGEQPFTRQVWICGKYDMAGLLAGIGGWAVGCQYDEEHRDAVAEMKRDGYITYRTHRAPAGEWQAYALTDKGFELLRRIGYGTMYDDAVRREEFYRINASALTRG